MTRKCSTCQHIKRVEVDRRLAAGEPGNQIARDYDLNPSSLHRHRVNCLGLSSSNAIMKEAAESGPLQGILQYNTAPLVSVDFNHNPASSTFDATLTKVSGRLVKVSSWYDNEWGFSNRMLDTTVALMTAKE